GWRERLVVRTAPRRPPRIGADLWPAGPRAALGPRREPLAGPDSPRAHPPGPRDRDHLPRVSERAGAGDPRARPPLLQRPGRRTRAPRHRGGERRLRLDALPHLR